MRVRVAQMLAAITGVVILVLAILFAFLQQGRNEPSEPSAEDKVARGLQVYQEQNCAVCHSIAGVGNRRFPLDGIGTRLTPDVVRRWIVDPKSINPRVRKPDYTGLSDEEIEAMVTYLMTLREEAAVDR